MTPHKLDELDALLAKATPPLRNFKAEAQLGQWHEYLPDLIATIRAQAGEIARMREALVAFVGNCDGGRKTGEMRRTIYPPSEKVLDKAVRALAKGN
jgi:hypothetical protein